MAGPRRKAATVTEFDSLIENFSPEDQDLWEKLKPEWEHRLENQGFVRAFAWAQKKGNGPKGCVIFANTHSQDFENSDEPVVVEARDE